MNDITSYGVIGATGKVGSRVADRLEETGARVRRLSRGSTIAFDWEQPDSWKAALRGLDRVFVVFVPDLASPSSAAAVSLLTEVAIEVGVSRLVLLSGRGESGALVAEKIILESALESSIVRASWFIQNFTEGILAGSVSEGFVAVPAGDRVEPFIDVNDIADVAVAALTAVTHEDRVIEVTGPELLTFADAAALLSESTGHPVSYLPVSLDEFHAAISAEINTDTADLLTDMCREVFDGRNESLATGVVETLGREPRSMREVLAATEFAQ